MAESIDRFRSKPPHPFRTATTLARSTALWLTLFGGVALRADDFDAWVLNRGQIATLGAPVEKRLKVGSLQKPFLVRAWASMHPHEPVPRALCAPTSGCWRPTGHGTLDLRGAIRESCNTYFRQMARETPPAAIREAFERAGFTWTGDVSDAEAIGLPGPAGFTVAPERLLSSYTDLVRTPWVERDDIRRELIEGMKEAVQLGTASGLRLWGLLGKTGTVPALDGAPLRTSGFALILDDTGFAFLGLLRRGTGREAAIRAGDEIARLRTGLNRRPPPPPAAPKVPSPVRRRGLDDPVRVRLLDELRLTDVRLRNLGTGPIDSSRGFIGPGASVMAAPGDHFSAGRWEITAREPRFERGVHGALVVEKRDGPIRLLATMSARDYANGILKAELGPSPGPLRAQLAAATLRYLQRGARHPEAEVCDSTHCAWFVGEGPVPRWLRPDLAREEKEIARELSDAEWAQALRGAGAMPRGPDLWTADCGGDPASPHFVWGGGDRSTVACPRHPKGSGRVWRRDWREADITASFGSQADSIDVAIVSGQWRLRVRLAGRLKTSSPVTLSLTYDDAHRRLAKHLGWDAMPAPAARVSRTATGFRAEGTGFGHRVGLCLTP